MIFVNLQERGFYMKNTSLLTALVCCGVSISPLLAEDKVASASKPATQAKQETTKTANLKIGTWNMYENLSKDGSSKEKQVAINELQTKETAKLEEKRVKSTKRFEEFNAKKDMLSKDAREKEEKELLALSRDMQIEAQKAQELVRAEVAKLTEGLALEAETAAIEVAKSLDLDLLLEKNTGRVVYEKSTSHDITAQVGAKMNKNYEIKLAENKKAEADAVKTAKADDKAKTAAVKA